MNQLNYFKEYLRSQEHLWVAVGTLGGGLAVGNIPGLLVGLGAYAIAAVFVPDSPFFKRKVDNKSEELVRGVESAQTEAFRQKRDAMRYALKATNQSRYNELAAVCLEIEAGGAGNDELFSKLDDLMWTFLKLLAMEEAIERFLEESRDEDIDGLVLNAENELASLGNQTPAPGSAREKLLSSRTQVVEVLHKRKDAIVAAEENLGLIHSEQERLGHQIRLLRAESIATTKSDVLTAKINASVANLQDTNALLNQMNSYQELATDMPEAGGRVGYGEVNPPQPARRVREGTSNQNP